MKRIPFRGFALLLALLVFSPMSLAQEAGIDEVPAEDVPADDSAADEAQAPQRDPTAADPAPVHPELRAVFEQFGGEAGLTALMEEFMAQLLLDPRTKSFFENVDQKAVKRHLVEQFCAILGGGCAYTGRDMKSAHAGLGIARSQFNALVEDLQIAMDKRGIPFRAQNQLLAKLAPMHREVETR